MATNNPYEGMRTGCKINCVNGEQRMQCPALPAIDKVIGTCAGNSITMGVSSSNSNFDIQAMHTANLARIAAAQDKMNTELQEANARMNPPKTVSPPTNPAFVAAGMAGIAQAKARMAAQKKDSGI